MNRRGEGASFVKELVLIAILILVGAGLVIMFVEQTSDDFKDLSGCNSRATQAGGLRGACATTSTCTGGFQSEKDAPQPGEYGQYLGFECKFEEPKKDAPPKPTQYCCMILKNDQNPPAVATPTSSAPAAPPS